jgi:hypothetical protein
MLGFLLGSGFPTGRSNLFPGVSATGSNVPPMALESLASRVDQLELACAGLWKLLKDKHGYADEELVKAVRDVDESDGQVDGRYHPVQASCPACGRKALTRARGKCLWCGAEMPSSPL